MTALAIAGFGIFTTEQRDLSGKGSHIDIAMTDAMFTFAWHALATGHVQGRFPEPGEARLCGGSPRYQLYPTADEKLVACAALEQKFWSSLCEAVGLPRELRDDRKAPLATREALKAIIGAHPARYWHRLLAPLDCCCTVVASLEEALADPHFMQRGLFDATALLPGGGSLPALVLPIARQFRGDPEP